MALEFRPFVADRNHPTFADSVKLMQSNFPDRSATSAEFLDWLYLQNPYKKAIGYICYDDNRPVSQLFVTFQMGSFQGSNQIIGIASNACTESTHRKLGLFHKIFTLLMADCKKMHIPFVWAYPNPSSLRGFQKTGFQVVKDVNLEITPVTLVSAAKDFLQKKTDVLGETVDLPWNTAQLKGFREIVKTKDESPSTAVSTAVWQIPLTELQIQWRYLNHPTRKYYVLHHGETNAIVVLRLFSLFGVKTAGVMKTSSMNSQTYAKVLKDLKPNLKNTCSIFMSLGTRSWSPLDLLRGRIRLPIKVSPRRFPLAVYPLQKMDLTSTQFEFSFGDYEAL